MIKQQTSTAFHTLFKTKRKLTDIRKFPVTNKLKKHYLLPIYWTSWKLFLIRPPSLLRIQENINRSTRKKHSIELGISQLFLNAALNFGLKTYRQRWPRGNYIKKVSVLSHPLLSMNNLNWKKMQKHFTPDYKPDSQH